MPSVIVVSPLSKLITPPAAKNKSDHIRLVVPSAAASLVAGDATPEASVRLVSPVTVPPVIATPLEMSAANEVSATTGAAVKFTADPPLELAVTVRVSVVVLTV